MGAFPVLHECGRHIARCERGRAVRRTSDVIFAGSSGGSLKKNSIFISKGRKIRDPGLTDRLAFFGLP